MNRNRSRLTEQQGKPACFQLETGSQTEFPETSQVYFPLQFVTSRGDFNSREFRSLES